MEFVPITGGLLSITNINDPSSKVIFHPEQKTITMGSSKTCTLCFENENILTVQATIEYISSHAFWNFREEEYSENSTLLYGINEYPLSDGMVICIDKKEIMFEFKE